MNDFNDLLADIQRQREELRQEFYEIEQRREINMNNFGPVLLATKVILAILLVVSFFLLALALGPHSTQYVALCYEPIPVYQYKSVSDWADWMYSTKGYIRMTDAEIKKYCE